MQINLVRGYFELDCKAQLAGLAKSKDIVFLISCAMRKRYQSFSFGNEIWESDEQTLMEENIRLTEQIDKMKAQVHQQFEDINVLRNQLNKQMKIEERPYIEQMGERDTPIKG